jgi:hypothetical protein
MNHTTGQRRGFPPRTTIVHEEITMLGLRSLFAALARLTASINRSADLFDAANQHLAEQLGYDRAEVPALEQKSEDDTEPSTNGRRRKATAK